MTYTPDPAAVAIVAGLLSTIDFPPNVVHPVLMEPMAEAVIVALVTEGHLVPRQLLLDHEVALGEIRGDISKARAILGQHDCVTNASAKLAAQER